MEKWQEYWIACIEGISCRRKWEIRCGIDTPEELYYIEETRKNLKLDITDEEVRIIAGSRETRNWKEEYKHLQEKEIHFVCRSEAEYPKKLSEIVGAPYALYWIGKMPVADAFSVAIVGARRCTSYGEKMTLEFAETLAGVGVQIISGMARGIDGAAHRGALNVGGDTYAVLGCGVDRCYPGEHKGLYQDLIARGGVFSEYPPGTLPLPYYFPARNRIISGLADVVLVMEAREKSGSLITADIALEQGRDVYALPGPVTGSLSQGCNRLIRQGAGILLSPEDLLEELQIQGGIRCGRTRQKEKKNKIMLETAEEMVYSKLDLYPKSREELLGLVGGSPQELAGILVSLELKGYISEISKNYYVRR